MKFFERHRFIFFLTVFVVMVSLALFMIWSVRPYQATATAFEALQSNDTVAVDLADWYTFRPKTNAEKGFIFYPGGRVDPVAYAPMAKALAEQGYLVIITPMPLNLAVLDVSRAAKVISKYPDIKEWYIGGHSLGGTMAARFADNNSDISGLILLAAYPEEAIVLSDQSLKTLVIQGTLDPFVTNENINAVKNNLPQSTIYNEIAGGNHAQFGNYGEQIGDSKAAISPADQQNELVKIILNFLQN